MASLFCPECGTKNMYTLKKPNFCQGCGQTFSAFGMQTPRAQQTSYSAAQVAQEPQEESVPDISRLEYEIDIPKGNKMTFESLVNNPINPNELNYNTKKIKGHKKMTKEQFLKQSQADCASSRGRFTDIGGSGE